VIERGREREIDSARCTLIMARAKPDCFWATKLTTRLGHARHPHSGRRKNVAKFKRHYIFCGNSPMNASSSRGVPGRCRGGVPPLPRLRRGLGNGGQADDAVPSKISSYLRYEDTAVVTPVPDRCTPVRVVRFCCRQVAVCAGFAKLSLLWSRKENIPLLSDFHRDPPPPK